MSDIVTCTVVLKKSADRTRPDRIGLITKKDEIDWRDLPCGPVGFPRPEGTHSFWTYEELPQGKLRISPSLNCLDRIFHTSSPWEVSYQLCPADADPYEFFLTVNALR